MLQDHYEYNAIQINRYDPMVWPSCDIHKDSGNRGDSRMIVLGDFEGGDFLIYEDGRDKPPRRIRQRYQWIAFDGHFDHGSTPITRGLRYSVVAFTFGDRE